MKGFVYSGQVAKRVYLPEDFDTAWDVVNQ
jgi:hypothetical protein